MAPTVIAASATLKARFALADQESAPDNLALRLYLEAKCRNLLLTMGANGLFAVGGAEVLPIKFPALARSQYALFDRGLFGRGASDEAEKARRALEEERRLFYVALTRARDNLYVYFALRFYRRPRSGRASATSSFATASATSTSGPIPR